jgi:hypothetical protein
VLAMAALPLEVVPHVDRLAAFLAVELDRHGGPFDVLAADSSRPLAPLGLERHE